MARTSLPLTLQSILYIIIYISWKPLVYLFYQFITIIKTPPTQINPQIHKIADTHNYSDNSTPFYNPKTPSGFKTQKFPLLERKENMRNLSFSDEDNQSELPKTAIWWWRTPQDFDENGHLKVDISNLSNLTPRLKLLREMERLALISSEGIEDLRHKLITYRLVGCLHNIILI